MGNLNVKYLLFKEKIMLKSQVVKSNQSPNYDIKWITMEHLFCT